MVYSFISFVMAILVISVSSDSSEDNVGTPAGRVILFGTIPTTIPDNTLRSPTTSGALRRRVMVLAPGQPIPHGRPYRYHLNEPLHMMTARKKDDSSSSSSSKTSSDSPADALSDSASS
ncbi:hypothetical protein Tco_0239224, partial [Tanacetum coccineum]